ncbi:hypothetical protein IGI39_002615 [Enterococcus sp. AZ135]
MGIFNGLPIFYQRECENMIICKTEYKNKSYYREKIL